MDDIYSVFKKNILVGQTFAKTYILGLISFYFKVVRYDVSGK